MNPIKFPGSEIVGAPEGMPNCSPIHAKRGVDMLKRPYWLTAWVCNSEDKAALMRDEALFVKTIGSGLPPMNLYTLGDPNALTVPVGSLLQVIAHYMDKGFSIGFRNEPEQKFVAVIMAHKNNTERIYEGALPYDQLADEMVISTLREIETLLT